MTKQQTHTRAATLIALLSAAILCGDLTSVDAASPVDTMPSFGDGPTLVAGTGIRRGRAAGRWSQKFNRRSSLPKENGEDFVDPDFEDIEGPAAAGTSKPTKSAQTASQSPPRFKGLFDSREKKTASAPSKKPSATKTPTKTAAARPSKPNVIQRPVPRTTPAPVAAAKPQPTNETDAKKSVDELLREMYAKDGREMPDMEYKPVPADNAAVRAARKKRGLPPLGQKKSDSDELVELKGVTLKANDKHELADLDADDFFPADRSTPAAPTATADLAPIDIAETVVAEAPAAKRVQPAPQKRRVASTDKIEIPTDPVMIPELVATPKPAAATSEPAPVVKTPAPVVAKAPVAVPTPTPSPAPKAEWKTPKSVPQWTARSTDTPSGWRAVVRKQTAAAPQPADNGWKSRTPNAVATKPVESKTLDVQPAKVSADPIANAFVDDEQLVATNESLDINPPAVDITTEKAARPADPRVQLTNREGLTGLKGFCPVTLCEHRDLVDADPRFAAVYQDRTYYVSSYEALVQFQDDPSKYAPTFGGLDPVHMTRDGSNVEGILDHAAWYRGRLYLFATPETLAEFSANPTYYITK